ncbi:MAG: methyltransferase domain-containing protein, partial [Acidobacteria bacterium]|nr:methyltransferase domain-containing protein [Acidobacteriota bacterium]
MSRSSTCIVIPVRESARGLVRTADSAARQSLPAGEIVLAAAVHEARSVVTDSVGARLDARVVRGTGTESTQVNAAVRGSAADRVVVVPPGFRLDPGFIAYCSGVLDDDSNVAAVAPAVRLHAADGSAGRRWTCQAATLEAAFADPRSTPPVLLVRRELWDVLGGFDESLPALVEYDYWVRILAADSRVHVIEDELVLSDVSGRGFWEEQFTRPDYLAAFRRVMEKHRTMLADRMAAVLVEREISFGRLRDVHRRMTLSRDEDLAELDRLRADTAHHRAYLAHHRRDGIDWGDLRRTDPMSREWGYDRGEPLDRYYIEAFLAGHSSEIRGAVLEVQEDDFTRRFGGPRVTAADIVDLDESNSRATIIADLRHATTLRDAAYDCIILTQTLHVIDDVGAVLRECYRLLKPGGVLLATMPCASRVCLEYGEDGDLWRMTPAGARALVERVFGAGHVQCTSYGNVLANIGFLTGAAVHELPEPELDILDPYFPALVGVRAAKPRSARARDRSHRAVVLLYHRIGDGPDPLEMKIPAGAFKEQLSWLSGRCRIVALEELLE